jgi:hypothetical protein
MDAFLGLDKLKENVEIVQARTALIAERERALPGLG